MLYVQNGLQNRCNTNTNPTNEEFVIAQQSVELL